MNPRLHEEVLFGHADSPEIGRCEICGRPIDRHRRHCLRCGNLKAVPTDAPASASRPSGRLLILLALLVVAAVTVQYRRNAAAREDAHSRGPGQTLAVSREAAERQTPRSMDAAPASSPGAAVASGDGPVRAAIPKTAQQPPEPVRPTPQPPSLTSVKVICEICEGRGRLPNPGGRSGTYACPVCSGSGRRTRRFLSDKWKLCDACKGMGAMGSQDDLFRKRNRVKRTTCTTCAGRGIVLLTDDEKRKMRHER